jgi:hypothetical protein
MPHMKKGVLLLFILPFMLSACFEEEAVPGFLNATTWVSYRSGTDGYNGGIPSYSYTETRTLTFTYTGFTYLIKREEVYFSGESPNKTEVQTEGIYTVKYPEITLQSTDNKAQIATLSSYNVLIIETDSQPLVFIKQTKK